MIVLWLLGCSEATYSEITQLDSFQQDRANQVDLLIVIDDSCSMVQEQDNLAANFDALLGRFTEAEVDWRVAVATTDVESPRTRGRLQGGDDEVILRGPEGEIDRVAWDRSWRFQPGVSLALSAELIPQGTNDNRENWCPVTATYGVVFEQGSPGAPNRICSTGAALDLRPQGPDLGPRPPRRGELVISELHPQSLGDDRHCEWIELTGTSPDTLELGGVEVSDEGRNHAVLPPFTLAPGERVVIGRDRVDNCDTPVDIALSEGFSLNDDLRWIDGSMPAAAELFSEAVAQGTRGSGIELGLEAAWLTLEEPQYSADNMSFLRDEARFALLFVSDEDDFSGRPVDAYLDRFKAVKGLPGYRDPSRVTVSAVVGTALPPRPDVPSCISDSGFGNYGERYLAAANRTGGLVASICADDFAPIVSELGLTVSGVSYVFELSRRPQPESLEVRVYADTDVDSLLEVLEQGVDYTWDPEANTIVFEPEHAPAPATWFTVRYLLGPGAP